MASARASLQFAVRDQLCASVADGGLALTLADVCEVMADGRPKPESGKWFYAVHPLPRTNNLLTGDEGSFACQVTITGRTQVPFDRVGTDQLEVLNGLDDRADAVATCIFAHQWGDPTPGVMNRANTYLGLPAVSVYGWTEAFYYTNVTNAEPVQPDWFSASENWPQKNNRGPIAAEKMRFCGLKIVVTFAGAKRLQELADATA